VTKRVTIYVSPLIDAALAALPDEDEDDSRSGRIATVCERYMAMIANGLARLSLTEAVHRLGGDRAPLD
jgi:hypothetical protein